MVCQYASSLCTTGPTQGSAADQGNAGARLVGWQTLWVLALMRDCQPPGQGEALLICRFSSSISCAKMPARLRAARRLSLLLYE